MLRGSTLAFSVFSRLECCYIHTGVYRTCAAISIYSFMNVWVTAVVFVELVWVKRTHFHTPSTPLLFCAHPELVSISFFSEVYPWKGYLKSWEWRWCRCTVGQLSQCTQITGNEPNVNGTSQKSKTKKSKGNVLMSVTAWELCMCALSSSACTCDGMIRML